METVIVEQIKGVPALAVLFYVLLQLLSMVRQKDQTILDLVKIIAEKKT